MSYRGFQITSRRRSYLAERALPEQNAIYRLAGKTLAELHDRIDWWVFNFAVGIIEI